MTNKIYQENSTYTPLLIFPTCQNLFMCPLYRIYCKYHSKKFKKLFFWLQLNIPLRLRNAFLLIIELPKINHQNIHYLCIFFFQMLIDCCSCHQYCCNTIIQPKKYCFSFNNFRFSVRNM